MAFTPGTRAVISFVVDGVQTAQRQISSLSGTMDDFGGHVTGSLKELAAFAGVGLGLGAIAGQVLSAQREFDKLNASLITATGSTSNAAQAFTALQAFASTTPYSVKEATEAFIMMRNLGLDPSEKALRSYGNTAAAMGKDLNQMVEAVADAATGQFERLKEFGITAAQNGNQVALTFQGMTTKVGNNTKEIQAYLQSLGNINFAGAMEKRANTLDGAISNLGDTWEATMRTIAQNGIGNEMQSGVIALSNSLTDLGAILDVVGGAAKKEGEAVKESSVLHASLTAVFETVAVLGVNVAYVFTQVGKELGGLAAQAVAVANGDLAGAKAIGTAMKAEAEQARKDVDAKSEAILGASAKAQKASSDEAAALKKSGTDRLSQYEIELDAEKRRAKAKQDIFDIENKLNGVNAQTAGDLAKLKVALDTGAISQGQYAKYVAQTNKETTENSTAYKNQVKQLDMSSAAVKRRAEMQALLNQREQEHADFLKNSGQIDEEASIKRIAALQVQDLEAQKTATEAQLALAKKKIDNQKEQVDLAGQVSVLNTKISSRQQKEDEDLFSLEQKRTRLAADNYADIIDAAMAETKVQQDALRDQLNQNAELGKTPAQLAAITAARLRDAAARVDEKADLAKTTDLSGQLTAEFTAQADAMRKRAAAVQAGVGADLTQATQLLEVMSAIDEAAQSAASGMANSFGQVGTAIGGLTTALTGYGKTQAAIAAQLAAATNNAGGDTTKIARANAAAAQQSAQAQIKSYGDMASAGKGFFSQNSKGYQVMEATEKGFRAVEMAMAIKNMIAKSGLVEAFTGLFVAGKTTETAATIASVAPDVAASMAKGTAAAAVGVASQAQGDPYTALPRMAAMAAVMAALGFVVAGGGGSDTTAKDRQAANGTGTVLGDSSAKSDSINRAIGLTAKNTSTLIDYTASMVAALNSIETNIGSFASEVLKTSTVGTALPADQLGTASKMLASPAFNIVMGGAVGLLAAGVDKLLGGKLGAFVGKIGNAVFGGNVTSLDTGVTGTKTALGTAVSTGIQASQYTDTKTDGGWFHSDKYNTQLNSLGAAANDQFTLIVKSMADSVTEAAKLIGVGGDAFTQHLNAFVVDIGKISTKDMTGDDIQKALEAAFSKMGDDMANWAVAGLGQFQKLGEGSLETLVRVATDYAKLDASLTSVGLTFGRTGIASIAARESLIALMGGIDSFQSTVADYGKNFLTQAEQLAPVSKYVGDQLSSMGLAWIKTRADFKNEIDSLSGNLSDAGVQQTYAALMNLESAFAAVTPAIEDTTKSLQEIADERKDLQDQLDTLTMTSAQLLTKQRNALDSSNRALFDQVQAAQAAKDASDAAKSSLGDFLTSMKSFADSVKGYNNSLMTGSLSTLTPEDQYLEARRQFEQTKQAAAAGDKTAQSNLQAIENTFLTLSQKINGSDSQYSSDLAAVMNTNDQLSTWAASSVDVAQASLDALNQQVSGIADLNTIMLSVAQSLRYLPEVTGASSSPTFTQVALPVLDYSAYGTASQAPLVAAIKALQEEVKALRADAQQQTGDSINSNIAVTLQAADKVVAGARSAASDAAYAAANSTRVPT